MRCICILVHEKYCVTNYVVLRSFEFNPQLYQVKHSKSRGFVTLEEFGNSPTKEETTSQIKQETSPVPMIPLEEIAEPKTERV